MRTYRKYTYNKYCYKKYRYGKQTLINKRMKLMLVGILALIFFVQIIRLSHEVQLNHKAKAARSQLSYVQTGFEQDEENISQKDKAAVVSDLLESELGKPYVYGDEGPDSFDCSGLVKFIYSKIDILLPRITHDQSNFGIPVAKNDLRFGDIIFFSMDNSEITHTGIYIGNGYFEHAPKTGEVVKINSLKEDYYNFAFVKAVRVLI
jgi:cell wall-associated NlpC family hydrolase